MTLAAPESQSQRWIKYGANVVFSSLIVILLAVMLTWLAQSHAVRRGYDRRAARRASGRSRSISFRTSSSRFSIVALYPKLKAESHEQDYYQPVADLLNEYATKGEQALPRS